MLLSRRSLLLSAAAAASLGPGRLIAQSRSSAKIVIIGGGASGVTAARRLAKEAGGASITLVDPNVTYEACFGSNTYIGGLRDYRKLVFDYGALPGLGIDPVRAAVSGIERERREVRLSNGDRLSYDWLILAASPPLPSRCPGAPYERASMMAHALKASGRRNCKIVILDAKTVFPMQALFQEAWDKYYTGMIEWLTPAIHGGIRELRPQSNTVVTDFEYEAALVNVIPAQTAILPALEAGLTDETGFCPVEPDTMASKADSRIYAIGDASMAAPIPKTASAAISEGEAAARAILSALTGRPPAPAIYESHCWSQLAPNDCIELSGKWHGEKSRFAGEDKVESRLDEPPGDRAETSQKAEAWYAHVTRALFG
ncbi:MAG: FAD-dependent oxidoreductase [Rhodomicrobium sp.]|nr:FAD-dependent oxidoreductase [Rhodomicrobium sp.]